MTRYRRAVEPETPRELDAFLAVTPAAATFEVRYEVVSDEREFVTDIERIDGKRPSGAPVYRFVGSDSGAEFGVEFVARVVAHTSPLRREDYAASDAESWATELLEVADADPELVDPSHVLELIRDGPRKPRGLLFSALADVCSATPEACRDALPVVFETLEADDGPVASAASCLAAIGRDTPGALVAWTGRLAALGTADSPYVARQAMTALMNVAETRPGAVVDGLPALETVIRDYDDARRPRALYAVSRLAREHPVHIEPLVPALVRLLEDEDVDSVVVSNVAISLGHVAKEFPDVARDAAPAAATHLDAGETKVRNNAAGLLADIARYNPEAVLDYVDAAAALLDDEDDYVRTNVTGVLSRVAEATPDAVADYDDALVAALDDDNRLVRVNACWTLGYRRVPQGKDRLLELSKHDPDGTVRERAAWALQRSQGAV